MGVFQTYQQYDAFYHSIVRIFPLLSVVGSAVVIYMIVKATFYTTTTTAARRQQQQGRRKQRTRRQQRNVENNNNRYNPVGHLKPTYRRLMVTLCIIDIVYSIAFSLGSLMVPKEAKIKVDNRIVQDHENKIETTDDTGMAIWTTSGGHGTELTCKLQAILMSGGAIGMPYMNAMLMIYFVLTVRYNVSQRYMSTKFEPMVYLLLFLLWMTGLIAGIYNQVYTPNIVILPRNDNDNHNNTGPSFVDVTPDNYRKYMVDGTITNEDIGFIIPYCFVGSYPELCDEEPTKGSGVNCYGVVGRIFFQVGMLLVGILILIMFLSLIVIVITVRNKELASRRFRPIQETLNIDALPNTNTRSSSFSFRFKDTDPQQSRSRRRREMRLTNRVTRQAIQYGIFFLNTYLWALAGFLMINNAADILAIIFQSSQGLFNCIVFMSPYIETYLRNRQPHAQPKPEQSNVRGITNPLRQPKVNMRWGRTDRQGNSSNAIVESHPDHLTSSNNQLHRPGEDHDDTVMEESRKQQEEETKEEISATPVTCDSHPTILHVSSCSSLSPLKETSSTWSSVSCPLAGGQAPDNRHCRHTAKADDPLLAIVHSDDVNCQRKRHPLIEHHDAMAEKVEPGFAAMDVEEEEIIFSSHASCTSMSDDEDTIKDSNR